MDQPEAQSSQNFSIPQEIGMISLVIPVYNEEESLVPLLGEIRSVLAELGRAWEVVFVDNGSTDASSSSTVTPTVSPSRPRAGI